MTARICTLRPKIPLRPISRPGSPTACICGRRQSQTVSSWLGARCTSSSRQVTYAQLLRHARHIASGLLRRDLSAERPIVILSGNSIDHALLAFGALYAGIPFCPVSPVFLFAGVEGLRQAFLFDEAVDARPGRRRRARGSHASGPAVFTGKRGFRRVPMRFLVVVAGTRWRRLGVARRKWPLRCGRADEARPARTSPGCALARAARSLSDPQETTAALGKAAVEGRGTCVG